MASWWVEYSQEAANYLEDNGALVAALFFAIEALAESEGIPIDGATQIEPGVFLFEPERHTVVYERDESRQIVRVTIIRPK
jgi:plasmid stabilization system protein ParE